MATTFQELRKQGRWSRRALAEKLNIDQSTIAKWERGESRPNKWEIYYKLSEIMGQDIKTLVFAIEAHCEKRYKDETDKTRKAY